MTWYKTGTVAVTPGSNAVLGTGTSFIANARVGDAFRGPDGEWYEVTNIASDTALSIAPDYQGLAMTAGSYSLAPMQGYVKDSADALRAATKVIASGVADMQEQVAAATEAAESAEQSKSGATEQAGIATTAASLSTDSRDAAQLAAQQSSSSAQASEAAADRSEAARDSIVQSEQAAAESAAAAAESAEHAEAVTVGKAASGDNNDITSLRALTADGFDRIRQGITQFVGATASVAGTKGLVPAPSIADRLKVLRGDGTYVALTTGAAWGAITGALSAQTDLQAALDAKGSVFTKEYTTDVSFTAGGLITITHNLGLTPKQVEFQLVCTAANNGFAVGATVNQADSFYYNGSAHYGLQSRNKTNSSLMVQVSGGLVVLTGANSSIVTSNTQWQLRINLRA